MVDPYTQSSANSFKDFPFSLSIVCLRGNEYKAGMLQISSHSPIRRHFLTSRCSRGKVQSYSLDPDFIYVGTLPDTESNHAMCRVVQKEQRTSLDQEMLNK